jgi:hypothetical protein
MPKVIKIPKVSLDKFIDIASKKIVKEQSEFGLKESIHKSYPAIKDLQEKGYSYEEISKMFAECDILIGATTLKQYVCEFTKQESSKAPKKSKTTTPKTINANSLTAMDNEKIVDDGTDAVIPQKVNVPKLAPEKVIDTAPIDPPSSSASPMSKFKAKP